MISFIRKWSSSQFYILCVLAVGQRTAICGEPTTISTHHGPIVSLAFTSDGKSVLCANRSKYRSRVEAWDLIAGKATPILPEAKETTVYSMALSPDGKTLAIGHNTGATLWNFATREKLRTQLPLEGFYFDVHVAFSHDNRFLGVTESYNIGNGIEIWRLVENKRVVTLRDGATSDYRVNGFAFTADGSFVIAACSDGRVRVWRATDGAVERRIAGHVGPAYSVACCPDGNRFASCGLDGAVLVWDRASGKKLRSLSGFPGSATCLSWSLDGRMLAAGGEGIKMLVWNVQTGQSKALVNRPVDHSEVPPWIDAISFSPDSKALVSGDADGTIKHWSIEVPQ